MIETYFGLSRPPFLAVPDVKSYFPSETIESARTNVLRCLHRGEGISLIVGPSGVGKTLLLRLLGLPFHLDYAVVNISNHRLKTPKAFLQQVLFELQQPFCGSDENELRLLLWDHLRRSTLPGVILLVDEGQTLSMSVLEEIRQMLNCDNGLFSRFRVAIAGTLALEERLTHPKLKAFNQWIVSRSYLEPLTRTETSEYILWQTQIARNSEMDEMSIPLSASDSSRKFRFDPPHRHSEQFPLFDDLARTKIYELTGGVPRLINQLCDHALVLACETNHAKTIDEPFVRAAWASLQQIPESKPETKSFPSSNENVIEFGTLDDDFTIGNSSESPATKEVEEYTPPFFSSDVDDEIDTDLISDEELEAIPQKPNEHVYQVKSFYKAAYPNGPTEAMCNWVGPGHQIQCGECGFGTPYREILHRDLTKQSQEAAFWESQAQKATAPVPASVALPYGMVVGEAKTDDSRQSLAGFAPEVQKVQKVQEVQEEREEQNIPTPLFRPEATVIRLHLGHEAEPACQKSSRRKTLQEAFEEEISVPRSLHSTARHSTIRSKEQSQDDLVEELKQLQQSLAQGVAFRSVKRVASLLEESESREQTLRFDPDVSRHTLSKPKFLTKPATEEEELVTLDFQRERRKISASDGENGIQNPEFRSMWVHSEPKAKSRPPLKLRKPVEDSDELFAEPAKNVKPNIGDFEAFFSKIHG
ncbi:MAG: AAA family ATPase [Planctomycetaceae bacterium]|nr:AAA family ATPase [Planctomycetaceae bacterium]MCL2306027.1 AAA family ATPase [Planctomycetaceae bacterium]